MICLNVRSHLVLLGGAHCRTDLAAKEEERVWVKRQTDGELDDSRLTEGLTGEATVYKRRGMEKPELGRPQIKCVLLVCKNAPAYKSIDRNGFASSSI